jgi:hypothetical protein
MPIMTIVIMEDSCSLFPFLSAVFALVGYAESTQMPPREHSNVTD